MWSAAEAEARTADLPVTVDLCDTTVDVPPMWQWPRDGIPALLAEAYEDWAQLCLPGAEYRRWADVDPTVDEVDDLLDDWEFQTGQSIETIGTLWHVLDKWPDQLEADLSQYHQQDIRHLWQPSHGPSRLTWRRLGVFYAGLPGHSLTKTAQANDLGDAKLAELAKRDRDGHAPFSHTDMLICDLIDAVRYDTYILQLVNTDEKKRRSVKPPEPVHRPGLVRGRRRGSRSLTPEARALLAYMAEHRGAMPPGQWKNVAAPPSAPPSGAPAGR